MRHLIILALTFVSLLSAQKSESLLNRALELFESRHLNSDHINTSAQILEQITQSEPENLTALYKLSQIYYTIADHTQAKSEKLDYFNKGIDYGRLAIKVNYNSAWAHFWYLANLGAFTQLKGVFSSLLSVSEVKKEIDIVLKLDPNNVWALNAQANVYSELPGILGGDVNRSIEILNRAIAIDANYSLLYVSLAQVYIKKKDFYQARYYLEAMLNLKNPWPVADFVIDDKPNALRLLEQIKGK